MLSVFFIVVEIHSNSFYHCNKQKTGYLCLNHLGLTQLVMAIIRSLCAPLFYVSHTKIMLLGGAIVMLFEMCP